MSKDAARQAANEFICHWTLNGKGIPNMVEMMTNFAATHVRLARAEGRKEGLEAAARVCIGKAKELEQGHHWSGAPREYAQEFRRIAAAIRALIEEEEKK